MRKASREMPTGADLILRHCAALERLADVRPSAADRLEQALGGDLAQLLMVALAAPYNGRTSSSP
jgi:hypothetical protein